MTVAARGTIGECAVEVCVNSYDDRVLDEFLNREIGGGIRLGQLLSREELRAKLAEQQSKTETTDTEFTDLPIQPQRRRVQARKRLNERTRSVANRVLNDLSLPPAGRQVGQAIKSVRGQSNRAAMIELMNHRVNQHIGISSKKRSTISADQAEDALAALDQVGDSVADEIRAGLIRNA